MEFFEKKQMVKQFIDDLSNQYMVSVDITVDEKDTFNVYLTSSKGIIQLFVTNEIDSAPFRQMMIGFGVLDSEEITYWYDSLLTTKDDIEDQFHNLIAKLF